MHLQRPSRLNPRLRARQARVPCRIVGHILSAEPRGEVMTKWLAAFRRDVVLSKLRVLAMLRERKEVNAPSRVSTLVNYVGLEEGLISTSYAKSAAR